MKFTSTQIKIVLGLVVLFVGGFYVLSSSLRSKTTPPQIELTVWGTDPAAYFDGILQAYKTLRPNVTILYKYIDPDGYNEAVLDALASGKGPDVFMISNTDLPKQQSKIVPVNATTLPLVQYRDLFPTVAEQDFVRDGQVYAAPLYIDDLALIYNKSMFDAGGIVSPPVTWAQFQDDVAHLRSLNSAGQVVLAGAAVGGSLRSVANAQDIIYALMLQRRVPMTDASFSTATFASADGVEAFSFYLRFADAASSYYTWNDAQPLSTDAVATGKAVMMIGYKGDVDAIKKSSPFSNIAVAPLPQLTNNINDRITFASYKGLAVSKQAKEQGWAWDFVIAAATNSNIAKGYAQISGRSPALRSLIADSLQDPNIGVFARQALVAQSWYQVDSAKISNIFDSAIRTVLQGSLDPERALRQAKERVDQLIKQ